MKRAMASAKRVACNEKGDGNGGKSDGYKCDRQAKATRVMVTRVMATAKGTMAMAAVGEVVVATATAIVTVMAAGTTTEWGSSKVTKGEQATAKVNRRGSSAQHNNQQTTKWGSAKEAREKQTEAKRRSSGARCMQQPTNK
jgi:hypothetical protein